MYNVYSVILYCCIQFLVLLLVNSRDAPEKQKKK